MKWILLVVLCDVVLINASSHTNHHSTQNHHHNQRSPHRVGTRPKPRLLSSTKRSQPVKRFTIFSHARHPRDLGPFNPLDGVYNILLHRGVPLPELVTTSSTDEHKSEEVKNPWRRDYEDRIIWTPAMDGSLEKLPRPWNKLVRRHSNKDTDEEDGQKYGGDGEEDYGHGGKGSKGSGEEEPKSEKNQGPSKHDWKGDDDEKHSESKGHSKGSDQNDDKSNPEDKSFSNSKSSPKSGKSSSKDESSSPKDGSPHHPTGKSGSTTTTTTTKTSTDCTTLKQFHTATLGSKWTSHQGWATATNCCSWYGVTCSSAGKVTSLSLGSNNVVGDISGLFKLTALTSVDLSGNGITTLPNNFTPLHTLDTFLISNNQIISPLPTTLLTLPSIHTIDLSNNNFQGSLPSSAPPVTLKSCTLSGNSGLTACPGGKPSAWTPKCGISCSPPAPSIGAGAGTKGKSIPVTPLPGENLNQVLQPGPIRPLASGQASPQGPQSPQQSVQASPGSKAVVGPPISLGGVGMKNSALGRSDFHGILVVFVVLFLSRLLFQHV